MPLMYGDCFLCEMILEMVRLGLDLLFLMALSYKEYILLFFSMISFSSSIMSS
jgi:hypothetical protein